MIFKEKYDVYKLENRINIFWKKKKNNLFNNLQKKNVCILLPPPNITGKLHLGHALQYTLIDIIIRYNIMLKKNTLWLAGLDHAGIATQLVVENYFKKKKYIYKKNNYKNILISFIKKWKDKFCKKIIKQMQYLGCSIDWKKYIFTMDKKYCLAVNKAFIHLYEHGFIYKAKKIVNWDPILKTAISDLEITNNTLKGNIYYIKYYILDNPNILNINLNNYIIITNTNPEKILGDVALIINPNINISKKLLGKFVIVPIINRIIPIIIDKIKIYKNYNIAINLTPGHNLEDYELAKNYNLPIIKFYNKKAISYKKIKVYKNYKQKKFILNNIPKEFQLLDRFILRRKIIKKLIFLKLIIKIKQGIINININTRNNVITEPMLTNQWYLKTKNLSKLALIAVKKKKIKFISKKYESIYFTWLKNIKDWCISRQIIWGHRLPVWYDNYNNIYVGYNEINIRKKYNLNYNIKLKQENDVLDTWFSSSLWSFASLGWPTSKKLLKKFYPTTILVSGFDIIYFWIVRMIMMSMYFIKSNKGKGIIPFKKIFITGLICDLYGKKMSKSKGNVLDPIDLIKGISLKKLLNKKIKGLFINNNKNTIIKIVNNTKKEFPNGIEAYGADALRLTLTNLSTINNREIKWNMNKLIFNKSFCNKIWNASLFILLHLKKKPIVKNYYQKLSIFDYWILFKLNIAIKIINNAYKIYNFTKIIEIFYKFFKNYFCDWYLEIIKPILLKKVIFNNIKIKIIKLTLLKILKIILKITHPLIPFITEAIWQKIKLNIYNNKLLKKIIYKSFPIQNKKFVKNNMINIFINYFKKIIIGCRNFRNINKINNKLSFELIILNKRNISKKIKLFFIKYKKILIYLINTKNISFNKKLLLKEYKNIKIIKFFYKKIEINFYLKKDIFININKHFITKKIIKIKNFLNIIKNKLNNKNLIKYAPKKIIYNLIKNYKYNKYYLNKLNNN